jgi:teichuronic acid biosynthesis glycosyltransferase TuaG
MSLVSIILPYFKKEKYIKETIDSLLNQTYQNFEIIIVDDEISHDSERILTKIKELDNRIFILRNLKNLGAGYSRNKAIEFSKGDFLAFCDCDDLWDQNKLKKQLQFMKKLNISACHTSYNIINYHGKIIGKMKVKSQLNYNNLLNSCDIGLSTVIIRKKLIINSKIFFPNIKTKEDYILWLKLAKKGVIFFGFNEKLTNWRKLKNSLSDSAIQKIFDGYRVYNTYLNYGFIKSVFRLFILAVNSILKK